ncbi:MAG: efflux RND transporter periplasmic adaptor subunit [Thermodesulfobacteriota bacterium]
MKKRIFYSLVAIIIGGAAGGGAVYLMGVGKQPTPTTTTEETALKEPTAETEGKGKKILYWQAPMDPTYVSEKPGKSPMGMDLIPVYEGEETASEPGTVKIDPVTVQTIGVRTQTVKRTELKKTVRTIGRIAYDEKSIHHIHTRVEGWIERLYFDYTGQAVKKGDVLLEIYSPQLVSTQEEYLLAIKYREALTGVGRESIADLARRRLEVWDVPEHQIRELEEKGEVMKTLHVHSHSDGIIIKKSVEHGMFVRPGRMLYAIADISKVWVYVDVYEYELPWIKAGQEAEMTLAAYPGKVFRGTVSFIYPFMEPETRTNTLRIEIKNPGGLLKPDMYANVTIKSTISRDALAVPTEAVIRSGERNVVIVARGGGKFTPVTVTLGASAEDHYEVLKGLKEGDIVVTSAQFLIDSESRLKEAARKMLEIKKGKAVEKESMEGMKETQKMDRPAMEHKDMPGMGGKKGMEGMGGMEGMESMDDPGMKEMDHDKMEHNH